MFSSYVTLILLKILFSSSKIKSSLKSLYATVILPSCPCKTFTGVTNVVSEYFIGLYAGYNPSFVGVAGI